MILVLTISGVPTMLPGLPGEPNETVLAPAHPLPQGPGVTTSSDSQCYTLRCDTDKATEAMVEYFRALAAQEQA